MTNRHLMGGSIISWGFPEVLFLTTKMADMAAQPSQLPRVFMSFLLNISSMIGIY